MSPTVRPSARMMPGEAAAKKRAPGSLKLAGLPRFHPANFPGTGASAASTPLLSSPGSVALNLNSPAGPPSPRTQYRGYAGQHHHQRQLSDAQRHLFVHQRDAVNRSRLPHPHSPIHSPPPSGGLRSPRPKSPHLSPLGSPGPVTPLELEERDGYLLAPSGGGGDRQLSEADKSKIVDSYIRKEARSTGGSPSESDDEAKSRPVSRRGESGMRHSHLQR